MARVDVKRIPTQIEGNHLYPLPADYESLTEDGRRQARVNACRQWLYPFDTAAERAEARVASLMFFDEWYLRDDEELNFYSSFYDEPPSRNALFHEDVSRALVTHPRVVMAAPRGSAKSTHLRKESLVDLVTRPLMSVTYMTSSNRLSGLCADSLMRQFKFNSRLRDDWDPECSGGKLIPSSREMRFSTETMNLMNGSSIFLTSAQSFNRGIRPRRFILDDIEYDPQGESTSMDRLLEKVETIIFKIILPMLRPGTSAFWIGTKISKRHLLYRVFLDSKDDVLSSAQDPRFKLWKRMDIQAEYVVGGKRQSVWPDHWPLEFLDEQRAAMGPAAYNSEYMNKPGDAATAYFAVDKRHEYWYEDVDDSFTRGKPWQSDAKICWLRKDEVIRQPLREFLLSTRRVITVDSSHTNTAKSDYKAAAAMALTPQNELFILDLFCERTSENKLCKSTLDMAEKWRVPVIRVETVKESYAVYESLRHLVRTRMEGYAHNMSFVPAIKKLMPGPRSKGSRIEGLQPRFGWADDEKTGGLIKFPFQLRLSHPWSMLFQQIRDFNPASGDDNGLANDDAIDVVSMSQQAYQGVPMGKTIEEEENLSDPIELLCKGMDYHPWTGLPLASYLDWSKMTPADVARIQATRKEKSQTRKKSVV